MTKHTRKYKSCFYASTLTTININNPFTKIPIGLQRKTSFSFVRNINSKNS